MAGVFLLAFLRRQQRRDQFERVKWESDMALRSTERADTVETTPYGGYVFVDMPDEYKGLFHDMLRRLAKITCSVWDVISAQDCNSSRRGTCPA